MSRIHKYLCDAYAELKGEYGLSDAEAVACWLEFIAERQRVLVEAQESPSGKA